MKFFTLHVRLTRDCNADCTYCSSAGAEDGRMSAPDFRRAIDFLADQLLPRLGIGAQHHLTIEYLGGEVLLVPEVELQAAVEYARERLRPMVASLRDGAQSNLIGSPRRITGLFDLFDGNLGTSWDQTTDRRRVGGSAEMYRGLLKRSLKTLEDERGARPGRVLVVDRATAPSVETEVRDACAGGYDLVLRPVFEGGSEDVEAAPVEDLARIFASAYQEWRANPNCRVEPFSSLRARRASTRGLCRDDPEAGPRVTGCPFQADCAFRSISVDPDGALHVCQEMADASNYPLGNAIHGYFDEKTWRLLARRSMHLSSDCIDCRWRAECGGGCMNEAIEANGDPFSRTELCPAWKAIFREIDADLDHSSAKP